MSASWNLVEKNAREYYLLNSDETMIWKSPKCKLDIVDLMSQLEELGVPPAYCDGLDEIYFAGRWLSGLKSGDYDGQTVRVVANHEPVKTLIHELGHHVDQRDNATFLNIPLDNEWRKHGHRLVDVYFLKDVSEYLARGFEVYYAGNKVEKRRMRHNNPVLYRLVNNCHRRYQKR